MNDRDSRENRIHGSEIKPFGYYACEIPNHFHCVPMHWHREFELNFVREGSASFICGEEKFHSAAGDIIIIQPNVMHSIYPRESIHQVYDTLVFRYEIFGGFDSDRAIAACIKPLITGKMHIPTHITTDHPYYAELEMMMNNIFSCAKGDTPQLDLLMRSELLRLFWLLETEATVEHDFYELGEAIRPALEYIAEVGRFCTLERKLFYASVSKTSGISCGGVSFPLSHQSGLQRIAVHEKKRAGDCI